MKAFRCGDVVPGCARAFTGTESEILAEVAQHAQQDHGLVEVPAELVEQGAVGHGARLSGGP